MNDYPQFTRTVYGHSFMRTPLEVSSFGVRGKAVLFCASFAGDSRTGAVLECFMREISGAFERFENEHAPSELIAPASLRRLVFVCSPNPDAQLVKSSLWTEDHPLFERIGRLLADAPRDAFCANGRGVDLRLNFNCSFAACRAKSLPAPSASGFCGDYPESEPESAAFARLLRQLEPRLLIVVDCGNGYSLPEQREAPWLRALCARHAPFDESPCDFAGSPEGWFCNERGKAALRIGAPPAILDKPPATVYALLRPLLFSLISF